MLPPFISGSSRLSTTTLLLPGINISVRPHHSSRDSVFFDISMRHSVSSLGNCPLSPVKIPFSVITQSPAENSSLTVPSRSATAVLIIVLCLLQPIVTQGIYNSLPAVQRVTGVITSMTRRSGFFALRSAGSV